MLETLKKKKKECILVFIKHNIRSRLLVWKVEKENSDDPVSDKIPLFFTNIAKLKTVCISSMYRVDVYT